MRLKVSPRNKKIGEVPNIALTPGESCVPGIPCYKEGCYAFNSYRQYPNVRSAWDHNLELYRTDPDKFFSDWKLSVTNQKSDKFRTFVGGDFPEEEFYRRYEKLVEYFLYTIMFVVYTKRYDYDYSSASPNSVIYLSTWPGWELPVNEDLPWTWLEEDDRKPKEYHLCPLKCEPCGYFCWHNTEKIPIVFPKHR